MFTTQYESNLLDNTAAVRVQIVDPSAYTPPYDHSLSAALAAAGADVELVTSRFLYGPAPAADGYRVTLSFYRRAARPDRGARSRRAAKLVEHVPSMLAARRAAQAADVVHYQWLPIEALDAALLARGRPRVFTAHKVLRRGGPLQLAASRRLMRRMDAIVALSGSGARVLRSELGAAGPRVEVIPHGAFDYLTRLPEERPLPAELEEVHAPVVLFFGGVRPHKGVDVLIEAFRAIEGAELWIVGMPSVPLAPLRALAEASRSPVRFVAHYVTDAEIPAFMRRADVLVLPHRVVDESGPLYCGLAFGKPMLLSGVGGFAEVAEQHGAARLFPPGDARALRASLAELLADAGARRELAAAAAGAAAGPYSWRSIAERTLELYRALGA